jgi:predicted MPP superfamily phosphohydrolase
MPVAYVHLSDIHFGQERGSERITHDDVKKELIDDAARQVAEHFGASATGIIVTGDTAYGGTADEYKEAAAWLDLLTKAVGCSPTAVQVVPGNHDIDRDGISHACRLMLDKIVAEGEQQLDLFLKNKQDTELLYAKFAAYRPFAEGYDCALDHSGGRASDRKVELAPGRILRFIGLNSALICSFKDEKGKLLLGAAQRVLPRTAGEELVVLCHHPLNWLHSAEARRYVKSRARVFVSGHEHNPSLKIDKIEGGCDLMLLAAGATVPPKAEGPFTYTYNLLLFDWDADGDARRSAILVRRQDGIRGRYRPPRRRQSNQFARQSQLSAGSAASGGLRRGPAPPVDRDTSAGVRSSDFDQRELRWREIDARLCPVRAAEVLSRSLARTAFDHLGRAQSHPDRLPRQAHHRNGATHRRFTGADRSTAGA